MKTNTYKHTFVAECPGNSQPIVYQLTISTNDKILVEHIVTACALIKRGYQEAIADQLLLQFGGHQTITAHHHGVDIETTRS